VAGLGSAFVACLRRSGSCPPHTFTLRSATENGLGRRGAQAGHYGGEGLRLSSDERRDSTREIAGCNFAWIPKLFISRVEWRNGASHAVHRSRQTYSNGVYAVCLTAKEY
jgi:hypothetical protein